MVLRLTSDVYPVFIPLGFIGFYRYIWYIIKILAYFVYKPMYPKQKPKFINSRDVTIIVPTIDAGPEFIEAAHSWLVNDPYEIIIVTEEKMLGPLQELAQVVNPDKVRVITVKKANKRIQMVAGIRATKTDIVVFADDDAIWEPTTLTWILACFEDDEMGGVGTSQAVKCLTPHLSVWETLAAFRLTQRNIEIASATHIDNGIPCLSGRTAAYRTCILKDEAFMFEFTHDFWLGKYPLNSGDDKFLTRWMVSHGWKTYAQVVPEANIITTFKADWRFLKQVLRWTRNTWRSDMRSVFKERYVWKKHPYTTFCMIDKFFSPLTLLAGPVTVTYMMTNNPALPVWIILLSYFTWLVVTRSLKLFPHFVKRPLDIIHMPAFILFSYYFAVMKCYAGLTLHVVAWGTRVGVDPVKKDEKDEKSGEKAGDLQRNPSIKIDMNRSGSIHRPKLPVIGQGLVDSGANNSQTNLINSGNISRQNLTSTATGSEQTISTMERKRLERDSIYLEAVPTLSRPGAELTPESILVIKQLPPKKLEPIVKPPVRSGQIVPEVQNEAAGEEMQKKLYQQLADVAK